MFLGRNGPGVRRKKENSWPAKRRHPLSLMAEYFLVPAPERGESFLYAPSRRSALHHPWLRRTPEKPKAADPVHRIPDFGRNLANWPPTRAPLPRPFSLAPDWDRSPRYPVRSSRRFGLGP